MTKGTTKGVRENERNGSFQVEMIVLKENAKELR